MKSRLGHNFEFTWKIWLSPKRATKSEITQKISILSENTPWWSLFHDHHDYHDHDHDGESALLKCSLSRTKNWGPSCIVNPTILLGYLKYFFISPNTSLYMCESHELKHWNICLRLLWNFEGKTWWSEGSVNTKTFGECRVNVASNIWREIFQFLTRKTRSG